MTKTLEEIWLKTTKTCFDPWTDQIERERVLKKVWIVKNMWETQFLKNSLHDFWSIEKQIRSVENASIDPKPIEHRSKHTELNQKFNRNSIDRKKLSIGRNFGKNSFFENQSKILEKLLKVLNFMNKMHEYEMKYFSKTLVLNPVFPKLRCSTNSP